MKKKFQEELTRTQQEIAEFKSRDHMNEAKQYVAQLADITTRLTDYLQQVSNFTYYFYDDKQSMLKMNREKLCKLNKIVHVF